MRDYLEYFVPSSLSSKKAKKVRSSHNVVKIADYAAFREKLTLLFRWFEFKSAYRASLCNLQQSGAELIAAYAARTTDL